MCPNEDIAKPQGHRLAVCCFGGDKRDRTADLLNAIQALSQLSYTPMYRNPLFFNGFRGSCIIKLCGIRGRSPVSLRSQLSYTPMYRNPLFFNGFRGSCIIKLCGIRGRSPVSLRSQLSYTPIFGFLTDCLRQLLYYSTPSGNVKHFFRVCRKFLKKLFRGRSGGQGRSSRPSKLASVRAFSQ